MFWCSKPLIIWCQVVSSLSSTAWCFQTVHSAVLWCFQALHRVDWHSVWCFQTPVLDIFSSDVVVLVCCAAEGFQALTVIDTVFDAFKHQCLTSSEQCCCGACLLWLCCTAEGLQALIVICWTLWWCPQVVRLNLPVWLSSLQLGVTSMNLVDPASSHMLVSKIKPCMSQYKLLYNETANGSSKQL